MTDRWRWFTDTDGSASREEQKFVLRCAFTQAQITLFVQFRWLTFTCEVGLLSLRPVGISGNKLRGSGTGPEVTTLPSIPACPPLRPRVTQGLPLRSVGRDFSGILESVRNSEPSRAGGRCTGEDRTGGGGGGKGFVCFRERVLSSTPG